MTWRLTSLTSVRSKKPRIERPSGSCGVAHGAARVKMEAAASKATSRPEGARYLAIDVGRQGDVGNRLADEVGVDLAMVLDGRDQLLAIGQPGRLAGVRG